MLRKRLPTKPCSERHFDRLSGIKARRLKIIKPNENEYKLLSTTYNEVYYEF